MIELGARCAAGFQSPDPPNADIARFAGRAVFETRASATLATLLDYERVALGSKSGQPNGQLHFAGSAQEIH
jgi:hypothetical protein